MPQSKSWNLEEDDDEEDEPPQKKTTEEDDEEVDPLDAYMQVSAITGRLGEIIRLDCYLSLGD